VTLAVNIFQRSARRRNGWEKREGVGAQCIAPRHFDAWEIAGSGIVSETPWPQGAGVLPSFQLSLPCDRASSETKRTLSRPTRTVQDMTVGSAKSLPFRRLILLVATYAHLQALLLSSQRREERGSPALGFIALRSYGALLKQVYDCCQYLQMKRAKKGTLFIPCINDKGFQAILGVTNHRINRGIVGLATVLTVTFTGFFAGPLTGLHSRS